MKGLKDKRVFITGAAAGIGRETAKRFYEEGASLVLIDITPEEKSEIKAQFSNALYIEANVTQEESLLEIYAEMEKGIDVLINNAGITRDSTLHKMTDEMWDSVIDVNLKSVFKLSQKAAKVMKEKGTKGAILNAASVVAHYGNFGQANYVATKAAVIGMTKTLAKELGKDGIRVNAVAPGFIGTEMVRAMPEKVISMVEGKTPLGRLGEPKDIAAMYAFLASEDASFITGATMNVDGGIILG